MAARKTLAAVGTGALILLTASPAIDDPGGLNAEGRDNDRKNGGYHGHRAPLSGGST